MHLCMQILIGLHLAEVGELRGKPDQISMLALCISTASVAHSHSCIRHSYTASAVEDLDVDAVCFEPNTGYSQVL